MATLQEAIDKLDKDLQENNSEEYRQMALILRVWLEYDEKAPDLFMDSKISLTGCWSAMGDRARKEGEKGVADAEAAAWILDHCGVKDPQAMLEGGLMYKILMKQAESFRPYGTEAPAELPASVEQAPKPTAPAELPQAESTGDAEMDALLADW